MSDKQNFQYNGVVLGKKKIQKVFFHILKTLSVLPYYLFYESAVMGCKLLHSQQQGTPSYLTRVTKEQIHHFEAAYFPTLSLLVIAVISMSVNL